MKRQALVLAAAVLITTPALAAPTARVSGNLAVRTGPGHEYRTIGHLPADSQVTLEYCTRNDRWCLVTDTGWVDASYLVGWSAKIPVTPFGFIGGPFADGPFEDDDDDDHGWPW